METKKFNNQSGQTSRVILVLAGAVLLVAVIVFVAIRVAGSRNKEQSSQNQTEQTENEPPKPVYDTTIGDIRFILQSSLGLGSFLKSETSFQQDLTTTERFIKVTVGAQNKGKNETTFSAWDVGNIIDSEGRSFIPITNKAYYFLPKPDLCGAILKPEFTPVPCVRMYEVSKQSKGLKVQVISKVPKQTSSLLDLNLPY